MPETLPHLFLVAGGTLGVENALKAAMDWKVRKNLARGRGEIGHQVIHFRQAFHGRSGYTLSMTNTFDPNKTAYFTRFDWPRIENPKLAFPLTPERVAEVEAAEGRAAEQIRGAFRANPDDICAIIIEPIQGEGGDNHFRPEFFRTLRTLADENEALLIFDEVQAGMGLTGRMWAYQHFGVEPDLVAFGKKTQVCGMMAGRRIDEVEENVFRVGSRLNSTWGGNLADMVRSARYLEIIEKERLVENAAAVGAHLLRRLEELQRDFPERVSNARGRGLMCAFDAESTEMRGRLIGKAYERGLVAIGCGEKTIRFRPSLTITAREIDTGIGILREALR
jgi:L-lysine 6-transaminase